eukprot:3304824-Alexandrium_andersonii.AAC.1
MSVGEKFAIKGAWRIRTTAMRLKMQGGSLAEGRLPVDRNVQASVKCIEAAVVAIVVVAAVIIIVV